MPITWRTFFVREQKKTNKNKTGKKKKRNSARYPYATPLSFNFTD